MDLQSELIPTMNIIGAGRVGQTLGKLFHDAKAFQILGIFNRSFDSAAKAAGFIGAGKPCSILKALPAADVIMIATADDEIANVAVLLQEQGALKPGSIVFHCSGLHSSNLLLPLKNNKVEIASIHPLMTFANPEVSVNDFRNVYCTYEGSKLAFELLERAFAQIGGQLLPIATEKKSIYHAAATIACNDLVGLLDVAVGLFVESGLTRAQALIIMQPLIQKTINNIFSLDTAVALTGPIARGDVSTVKQHLDVLANSEAAAVYKTLGLKLVELSRQKGNATAESLAKIEALLKK